MSVCASLALALHLTSWHAEPGYNEDNRGLGIRCDGWAAGAYQNSIYRTTAYVGRVHEWCWRMLCAGGGLYVATGYTKGVMVAPLPQVSIGDSIRVTFVAAPSYREHKGFVGASIEVAAW